jgi:hypothetical protein
MGKGSTQRPSYVEDKHVSDEWKRIFKKDMDWALNELAKEDPEYKPSDIAPEGDDKG